MIVDHLYLAIVSVWIILIACNTLRNSKNFAILIKKMVVYIIINFIVYYLTITNKHLLILLAPLICIELLMVCYKSKSITTHTICQTILFTFIIITAYVYSIINTSEANLIYTYMLVIVFDANSQLFGLLFRGRKIIPNISPNKTISGTLCGFISVLILYVITTPLSLRSFLFTVLVAIFAFIGDMVASLLKRKLNIKDYGYCIPYHGGIIDRFDSFVVAAMVTLLF